MAFRQSTNRWVTAHLSDAVQVHGQKRRFGAHPRGGEGRLDSRMTSPNHDHIVIFGKGKIGRRAHKTSVGLRRKYGR